MQLIYSPYGVTYRRCVTKLVLLASEDLPQYAAHDLATARLGEVRYDVHGLRRRKRSDTLPYLKDELFAERIRCITAVLDRDECVDSLSRELIGHTHNSCLSNGSVLEESRFDLGCRQTMATNVYNIINATTDPVEALVIPTSSIPSELCPSLETAILHHRPANLRSTPCTR